MVPYCPCSARGKPDGQTHRQLWPSARETVATAAIIPDVSIAKAAKGLQPQASVPTVTVSDDPTDTTVPLMNSPASHDQPSRDDASPPWYCDGLRFECTQCGNCCTGMPGFVWVDEGDIERIAEYLDKPVGEIRLLRTRPARGRISLTEYANGDCTFFDPANRCCTIYPVRPQQCRTWPFWRSNLTDEAAWAHAERSCPGAGTGQLIPLEEIERLASDPSL